MEDGRVLMKVPVATYQEAIQLELAGVASHQAILESLLDPCPDRKLHQGEKRNRGILTSESLVDYFPPGLSRPVRDCMLDCGDVQYRILSVYLVEGPDGRSLQLHVGESVNLYGDKGKIKSRNLNPK